jgi:hypothetical protein
VIVAAGLTGVILFIAAGLIWTARLVHIGNLDAQSLADKLDRPQATTDPAARSRPTGRGSAAGC